MSDTLTDVHYDWIHQFCGVDLRATADKDANQSTDPNAGQPTQSTDPDHNAGQPDQSTDPNPGQPNQSTDPDPNAGQPNQSIDPDAGQPTQSTDSDAGQPTQSTDPNAGQPNQSTEPPASDEPGLFGRIADGVRDAAGTAVAAVKDTVSAVSNAVSDAVDHVEQKIVDAVDDTIGKVATEADQSPIGKMLDPPKIPTRSLSSAERGYAHAIFLDTLDYGPITVTGGGVATLGKDMTDTECRTIGNDIGLSPENFNPDGTLTNGGLETLVHELTHAWQYQHGGWSYIRKALVAQGIAQVVQGDRGKAYEWQKLDAAGIPWKDWNPEAQAQSIEDYNKAFRAAQGGSTDSAIYQLLGRLQPYLDQMQAGSERGDYPTPVRGQKAG